ncbi:BglG family transcription antiterminator [Enterococcus sp. AZ163]|uniref:BglG family transcription antiterminator n=1 Tax=Enterococcus sp. AZ163 TaxID=2774638 RepID=UPI003D2DDC15
MDNRKSGLIDELKKNKIVDVDLFLKENDISFRTLQNDVLFINEELQSDVVELDKSFIVVKNWSLFFSQLEQNNEQTDAFLYKMSKEERQIFEILFILSSPNYVTGNELAKKLFVSRNTITNDLKQLRKDLQNEQLELKSKTNKGYKIIGEEKVVRKLVYVQLMETSVAFNEKFREIISSIFKFTENSLTELKSKLIVFFDKNHIVLKDDMFWAFILCVLFKKERMTAGQILSDEPLESNEDQVFMKAFFDEIYQTKKWLTNGEMNDLNGMFKWLSSDNGFEMKNHYYVEDQIKISSFVWEVCKDLDILDEIEYENYEVLCSHIISTVENIKKGNISQKNPISEELKALYPDIFEVVNHHIETIENIVSRRINENDITYIVMHMAVIVENHDNFDRKLRVALVCPNGRCVSMFLKNRLLNYFNVEIKDTIPAYKLDAQQGIDLVISTIPIEKSKYPVVVVNQMLLSSDMQKIRKCMRQINKKTNKALFHRNIENYVEGYQQLISNNAKLEGLEELNRQYSNMKGPFFFDQLKNDQMMLDVETKTWQEAVRKSGELLKDKGYINQNYIDNMIDIVEENGPYILFMPGFAIAHASPEDGANESGVSMLRMKKSLSFQGSEIKIKFIVCLSIPDKDSHVFLLYQIYKCLTNKELFNDLVNCKTTEEITDVLKVYEFSQKNR